MEVGDTAESGAPALFEKRPIFWQFAERRPEFPRFYSAMIALRKNSNALRRGDVTWLKNSDESRILTFSRKSGTEEILVAINMSSTPYFGSVEAAGSFDELTPSAANRSNSLPSFSLDGYGFRIFRRR
jgi:glycosidase